MAPCLLCACTCGLITPAVKPSWQRADLVFVGTLTGAKPMHGAMMQQTVWVHVDEPFKGVRFGETVILNQPGYNCARKFRAVPVSRKSVDGGQ
jgi:hypothetical protein